MPMSHYPNGFADGVSIRGIPINVAHPGKVLFVGNSTVPQPGGMTGSDGNPGTYQQPLATLQKAIDNSVDARGDIIFVLPGHSETIATASALTVNKAALAIVGLGVGQHRPIFNLSAATSTINVTAQSCSLSNLVLIAGALDISCITTTGAAGLTVSNCEFDDSSSILNFKYLIDTSAVSNALNDLRIEGCKLHGLSATAGTSVVKMDGTNAVLSIVDNYFTHASTNGGGLMNIAAGKVVTFAQIKRNVITLTAATDTATGLLIITDGTTNSGVISDNYVDSLDATTEILVTASSGFKFHENKYSGAADKSGYLLPAADA